MPLYWVIASYAAAIYITRAESIFLRSAILCATTGFLVYLYCTILLDWLIKIKHANIVAAMGIDISGPTRPTWWPSFLPPFDILALSILYIVLICGAIGFFFTVPFLGKDSANSGDMNASAYVIVTPPARPSVETPAPR